MVCQWSSRSADGSPGLAMVIGITGLVRLIAQRRRAFAGAARHDQSVKRCRRRRNRHPEPNH